MVENLGRVPMIRTFLGRGDKSRGLMTTTAEVQQRRISTIVVAPSWTSVVPILVGIVLLFAIILSAAGMLSIGFVFERNYNEGWNVYNAQRLIHHELIYDDNYWRVNNYPIFSFMAVAALVLWLLFYVVH